MMDLIGIYKTLHPKIAEQTFFSSVRGTFAMTDYILSHKTNLNLRKLRYQASFTNTTKEYETKTEENCKTQIREG